VAPMAITTASLPAGVANQSTPYSAVVAATGGIRPYDWQISAGALPPGLSLVPNDSASSRLFGFPRAVGTYNVTVRAQAKDANSSATRQLSITIDPGGAASAITLVQSSAFETSAATGMRIGFPASNTLGNLIIVFVRMATTTQTVTV